ncbi:DUF58 domain-containing protein [Gordonia sp. PKS22-38]|uniref:DUF58 domain-containing protein n=1 Tax=Gordonia prachuapensis TaxID=3115651 RepID=A0ABU7N094_9ACTN|nr:DUF58 domain-containing protein [Gordonia sp. PKS22-38]
MTDNPFRTLDLAVRRRLDSLVPGDHDSSRLGAGSEPEEVVRYQPGDDVRRIDWNITARSVDMHVWRPRADNQLDTWVLLDLSPSMAFGTVTGEKRDLAAQVVWAIGELTDAPGNRMGIATLSPDGISWGRPDRSRFAAHRCARLLDAVDHREGTAPPLADAVDAFARRYRRTGLRIVISDFIDPDGRHEEPFDWQLPLRHLAARHDVIAVEVTDPRERELPDVGSVVLADPESGRQRHVWTSDRGLREKYAAAAMEREQAIHRGLIGTGAEHLRVDTGRDWLRDLAAFLRGRRRTAHTVGHPGRNRHNR